MLRASIDRTLASDCCCLVAADIGHVQRYICIPLCNYMIDSIDPVYISDRCASVLHQVVSGQYHQSYSSPVDERLYRDPLNRTDDIIDVMSQSYNK